MTKPRFLTADELAIAVEMNAKRTGIRAICRRLRTNERVVERSLLNAGHEPHKLTKSASAKLGRDARQGYRDPTMAEPIGSVPPDHPFYEMDQAMARARANPRGEIATVWRASSLVE